MAKAERKTARNNVQPPLSILVCAKNEAQNLVENIPLLLKQIYPIFEILLINDASQDNTAEIIDDFSAKNLNLRGIHIKEQERTFEGKKYALTKAISIAKHEHLLFMDADCKPLSPYWAQEMAQGFGQKKQIVLGYGGYAPVKHSWLNKIIRFETVLTAVQYFGYAENDNAYMGVGRNLGYTKSLFQQHNGFSQHSKMASGDDDLFVNAAATPENVSCMFSKDSFSLSEAKTSWPDWFLQKCRHVSVANRYKKKHQISLGLFYISQFLPYILIIFLLFSPVFGLFGLFIFAVRYIVVGLILYAGMRKFQESGLIYWFPLLEVFLLFSQLSIFILSITASSTPWKKNRT